MTILGHSAQLPCFESAHGSSSISKTWIVSTQDSSGLPEIDSESTRDSSGFLRYWFRLTHNSKCFPVFRFKSTHDSNEKHFILSRPIFRLWVIPCLIHTRSFQSDLSLTLYDLNPKYAHRKLDIIHVFYWVISIWYGRSARENWTWQSRQQLTSTWPVISLVTKVNSIGFSSINFSGLSNAV